MDKRTWLTAIVGTLSLTGIATLANTTSVSKMLTHAGGSTLASNIYMDPWYAIIFVLPCVLTVLAKRRPFLWGVAPALISQLADFAYFCSFARHPSDFAAIWKSLLDLSYFSATPFGALLCGWVVSSSVGLAIRARIGINQNTEEASVQPEASSI